MADNLTHPKPKPRKGSKSAGTSAEGEDGQPVAKKASFHEQVAQRLIEALEAGTSPFQKKWQGGESFMPHNPTTGKPYKGINAFILMLGGYSDTRWLTYKQAEGIGAQVKKGEHGTLIEYWKFYEEEAIKDEDGKPVLDDEGKQKHMVRKLERPKVFFANVFNAEQIDNMPAMAKIADMTLEWTPHKRAEFIIAASKADIVHKGQDRAFYRPSEDRIYLPLREQFPSSDNYYSTALHELGHWTGHESRLDRPMVGRWGNIKEYAIEELRAEIASLMIGQTVGVGSSMFDNHAAYVQSWIEELRNNPKEIFRAAADADKILGFLLELEKKARQEVGEDVVEEIKNAMEESEPGREATAGATIATGETSTERVYLATDYRDRKILKDMGAKYDKSYNEGKGAWYVPPGVALEPFVRWRTDETGKPSLDEVIAEPALPISSDNKSDGKVKNDNPSWEKPSIAIKPNEAGHDATVWNPKELIQETREWGEEGLANYRLIAQTIIKNLDEGSPDKAIERLDNIMTEQSWNSPKNTQALRWAIELEWRKWQVANCLGECVTPEGKRGFEAISNNLTHILDEEGQQAIKNLIEENRLKNEQVNVQPIPAVEPEVAQPEKPDSGLEQVRSIQAFAIHKKRETIPSVSAEVRSWAAWYENPQPLTAEGGGELLAGSFNRVIDAIEKLRKLSPPDWDGFKPSSDDVAGLMVDDGRVRPLKNLSWGDMEAMARIAGHYSEPKISDGPDVEKTGQLLCNLVSHAKSAPPAKDSEKETRYDIYFKDRRINTLPVIDSEIGKWGGIIDSQPTSFEGMAPLWQSFNCVLSEIEGLRSRNPGFSMMPRAAETAALLVKDGENSSLFAKPLEEMSITNVNQMMFFAAMHSKAMSVTGSDIMAARLNAVFNGIRAMAVVVDDSVAGEAEGVSSKNKASGMKKWPTGSDPGQQSKIDEITKVYEVSLAWRKRDAARNESNGYDFKNTDTLLNEMGSLLAKYDTVFSGEPIVNQSSGKAWYPGEQEETGDGGVLRRSLRLDSVDGHAPNKEDVWVVQGRLALLQVEKNVFSHQIEEEKVGEECVCQMAM